MNVGQETLPGGLDALWFHHIGSPCVGSYQHKPQKKTFVTHFAGGTQNFEKKKKKKRTYSTRDSLVVPYQSTDRAQRCLTSQFGWDAVLSPWYDRMTRALREFEPPSKQKKILPKKRHTAPEIPL